MVNGKPGNYIDEANVPGLIFPANKKTKGNLWYKRRVTFPDGDWNNASLFLYGAKYMPKVYVNGECVSCAEGGLTITRHSLLSKAVFPGNTAEIEIELASLDDVPNTDASRLPEADLWRSDLSSHIWNDMYLDVYNSIRIDSVITSYDEKKDTLNIHYKTTSFGESGNKEIIFSLYDGEEKLFAVSSQVADKDCISIPLCGKCKLWSPETPVLYTLRTEVDGAVKEQNIGIKFLKIDGLGLRLNGASITLRMGSICWHRWQRDVQAKEIAYDENWFLKNILLPLKESGANTIRFHLGPPPEKIMDLCDRYGMLIQAEWSFFHGLEASADSLKIQWRNWLDIDLSHIGTAVVHPWNEISECRQIADARKILEEIKKEYPDFILSHRDSKHIHKYWWSLFENVGIYYNSKEQFGMPVLADEFGGNYLDYEYNPGFYPTLIPAFLRFLGENNTAEDRKWLQKVSHAKMAEYWRRMGVAGFSPFCMLSSPEDGNTYFEGNLAEGKQKPVFAELKAAYSPVSVSMNIWDRNFYPEQKITVKLYLFNDTCDEKDMICRFGIEGTVQGEFSIKLPPYSVEAEEVEFVMPHKSGEYTMYASVGEVSSRWDIIVTEVRDKTDRIVGIHRTETELADFLSKQKISYTYEFESADVIVGLEKTYNLMKEDKSPKSAFEATLNRGISVALLGMGPKILGEGYESDAIQRLTEERRVDKSEIDHVDVAFDISVQFDKAREPESCIHRTPECSFIWEGINKKAF